MRMTAWAWTVLAAVETGLATGEATAGAAVFFGLGALLFTGEAIIKAVKK